MDYNNMRNDYLSISEFAEMVGMTVQALRRYDQRGIFPPAARGEGPASKYRYYAPTQITSIKMIRTLTEIGVPLDTIKELANSRTPETLIKVLSKYMNLVTDEIYYLQEVSSVIHTFCELLYLGMSITEKDFSVSVMPERHIILGSQNDFSGSNRFFREYTRFCQEPHIPKLNLSYPIGGFFDSMDVFRTRPAKPTRFYSLDPKGQQTIEGGLYLTGYTRGYYGQTNGLPEKMWAFAKRNGLVFKGPVYNIYLYDELSMTESAEYLLQVSAAVMETRRIPSRRPYRHC